MQGEGKTTRCMKVCQSGRAVQADVVANRMYCERARAKTNGNRMQRKTKSDHAVQSEMYTSRLEQIESERTEKRKRRC